MKTAKLALVGCVDTGFFCAKGIIEAGLRPSAIISLDAEGAAKNKVSAYKDLFELDVDCERRRPLTYPMKEQGDINFFRERKFDLLIVLGWQRLIPDEIIETLRLGGLTIHGSGPGLPKGRGRSPLNWAIIEGHRHFHLSLLTLGKGADTGRVLDTSRFDILPTDDIQTLYYKNAYLSTKMLIKDVPAILEGTLKGIEQDESQATYYPKRSPEDGRIDWTKKSSEIESLVKAVTKPYPGAFSFLGDHKIMIWKAQLFDTQIKCQEKPGTVEAVFPDGSFIVSCADYFLLVRDYEGQDVKPGNVLL